MFRDFTKYEVFDDGRIWSYTRNKWLKPQLSPNGYLRVCLSDNDGNLKKYSHHRVVYEAVTGQPIQDGLDVNHINEIKTDNRFENLNLMTSKENSNWGTAIKRSAEKHKKPVYQYDKDGNLIQVWPSASEVHKQLGYLQCNISQCCNGKCKSAYGFIWRYTTENPS